MNTESSSRPPTPKAIESFDLTIVGGGPVGMYAAYYAGFQG